MGNCCSPMAVAGDVFDGVFLCCVLSHQMSWVRSGTELGQFLRIFLPTLIVGGPISFFIFFSIFFKSISLNIYFILIRLFLLFVLLP